MATAKYFYGSQEVQSTQYMRNSTFSACFPDVRGVKVDGYSKLVSIVNGEIVPVTRTIFFKSNPSLHKCDGRCLHAKGRNCECSCGGANHGLNS